VLAQYDTTLAELVKAQHLEAWDAAVCRSQDIRQWPVVADHQSLLAFECNTPRFFTCNERLTSSGTAADESAMASPDDAQHSSLLVGQTDPDFFLVRQRDREHWLYVD